MGATLPVLARVATDQIAAAGDRIGRLYAINTAGAVLGTALTGFWLLAALGVSQTNRFAAIANLAIGGAALAVGWRRESRLAVQDDEPESPPTRLILAVMAAAGFAGLVYEVVWTRVLALVLGPTVTVFAVMLVAFLIGIAMGGRIGGPVGGPNSTPSWNHRGLEDPGLCGAGGRGAELDPCHRLSRTPLSVCVGLRSAWRCGSSRLDKRFISARCGRRHEHRPRSSWGLHGRSPYGAQVGDAEHLGRGVGLVTGVNTLGGAVGAWLAGRWLLPHLEVTGTLAIAVAVNCMIALGLAATGARKPAHYRRAKLCPSSHWPPG